jgi:hypothetical protein
VWYEPGLIEANPVAAGVAAVGVMTGETRSAQVNRRMKVIGG